MDTTAQYCKL